MSSRNLSQSGTQDEIEYMSLSSGNIDFDNLERPERLHEWLKKDEIEALHNKFLTHKLQKLSYGELRDALIELNINFTDFEYNRLFLKINQNRDFMCDWDEFVSYLIFGFQEDDPSTQKEALIQPISQPPVVRKSEHRSAICAMTLMRPGIEDEDEENESNENLPSNIATDISPESLGMWLTASREGYIRFWNTFLESIRSGKSESIHLKMPTWILAIQALSDVSIVCTASTERELRFHEVVASTFTLRIVIRSMPFAVCNMSYRFHSKGRVDSKLVLGDMGGNVRVLEFNPFLRGPFQSKPGAALVEIYWSDILKGKLPLFKAREYTNFHSELIQETFYSLRLNSLFAAAEYRNTRKYRGRCPGLIVANGEEKTVFRIPLGVTTFFVDERNNIVVTGGPDTFVRIWDVYISSKPSGILTGHNSGVVMVFVQPDEKKVYSIDYQKIIKVWHLIEHTLLQTYGDLARIISPSETDLVYSYHEVSRDLIVGGRKIIALKCSPRIRVDLTDGNTHAQPVSVVLYNRLFRNVVTCGLDSYIIVWDPYTGRRKNIIKSCHTRMVYGEIIDIEITAGCFDPLEQFLLTGARDGSLKIWNYNNSVCIRNMSIKAEFEVTAVIWVVERILAVGWDKKVTEFNDVEGREYGDPKVWMQFHTDDITCADVKLGEGVVTATYSGEIIFWKLETGQPYRRYSVSEPTRFIELKHSRDDEDDDEREHEDHDGLAQAESHINVQRFVRRSISVSIRTLDSKYHKRLQKGAKKPEQEDDTGSLGTARSMHDGLPLSVQAVLFLQTRPMAIGIGSVFVALDTGVIQVYSHHQRGGYITEFNAIHKTGDCVLRMATDRKNRYLFTGTAFGYIKVWHIENYCIAEEAKKTVCMPLMRLQFIFLRRERFATRAKRVVRHQPDPMLVSSYKGHLKAITSIAYIDLPKILISGSYDCSCRLWTLGGRYLGTLGTPLPWMRLSPFESPEEDRLYRLPPDIQKVASSTTIKVISGVQTDPQRFKYHPEKKDMPAEDDQESTRLFVRALQDPVLGKHFALPGEGATEQRIDVDLTAQSTQVFTHLKVHEAETLERPPTPPQIKRVAAEEFMEFYMPQTREEQNGDTNEEAKIILPPRKSELKPANKS